MITVSKEDYLKAILEAESEGEAVISARLADWLKVSAPAVTMAVRRLRKDEVFDARLVRYEGVGRRILRSEKNNCRCSPARRIAACFTRRSR